MARRAVIYARVSSDDSTKDGRNLDLQLDMGREYAIRKGYDIVAQLAEDDHGASGAALDLPQLNRLLDLATHRQFDVLVVREIDRLSRNLAKQLYLTETLEKRGVTIEYVLYDFPDTPEGRLNRNLFAMMAEYEREKICERNIRGRRNVVRQGKIMLHACHPPYGYRMTEDGANLVIHEEEARIVRLIFQWYTQGDEHGQRLSTQKIADRLTEEQIPTWADLHGRWMKKRSYGHWSASSVLKMLHKETYSGTWYYGKKNQSKETWIPLEVPAIVPPEVWDAAQGQSRRNRIMSERNRQYDYLMRYQLRCGHCEHKIGALIATPDGKVYPYYVCYGRTQAERSEDEACALPYFRGDKVDELVWGWVKALLTDEEHLRNGLEKFRHKETGATDLLQEELDLTNSRITAEKHKRQRLLDLHLDGELDRETFINTREGIDASLEELDQRQTALKRRVAEQRTVEDSIQDALDFAAHISKRLDLRGDEQSFETRRQLIERLDVRGRLSVKNGEQQIELTCTIAPEAFQTTLTSFGDSPA